MQMIKREALGKLGKIMSSEKSSGWHILNIIISLQKLINDWEERKKRYDHFLKERKISSVLFHLRQGILFKCYYPYGK